MSSVTVSTVSHQQADLIKNLLGDLQSHCPDVNEVILTVNVNESLPFQRDEFDFHLQVIENDYPKGYSANHNAAFNRANGNYFCVLNPDIRLDADPFPELIRCLQDRRIGAVAPLIVNGKGEVEDSARHFPTPWSIFKKALGFGSKREYIIGLTPFSPEWVAGMFMLFRCETFREVGGFNEKFFLYYEDVDLCARFRSKGMQVLLCPTVKAVHDARRESHRSLKYLRWHLLSITRYFASSVFFRTVLLNRKSIIGR
jgi:GT2 family glycosyltransferase